MEKFLKFVEPVSSKTLADHISDERIIVLRESKTTGTIQVKVIENMTSKQIKKAFHPFKIKKIYDDFPLHKKHRFSFFKKNINNHFN